MKIRRRLRSAALVSLGVLLGGGFAAPVSAQFVVLDPSNLAENIRQVAIAMDQINNQRQQIQYQLQALLKLGSPTWGDIRPLLQRLDWLMQQAEALGYSLGDIDRQFQETYPGWQVSPNILALPPAQRVQAERALGTMRAAMNVLNEQSRQFETGQTLLTTIKAQMSGIQGTQEALELQATLDAFIAEEISLLRQTVTTQTNVQAVYNAYVVNQEAETRANYRAMVDHMSVLPARSRQGFTMVIEP